MDSKGSGAGADGGFGYEGAGTTTDCLMKRRVPLVIGVGSEIAGAGRTGSGGGVTRSDFMPMNVSNPGA